MRFARDPGDERADEAEWPQSHRKTFLERLAAQGCAAVTIQQYRTIAGRFCDAIEKRSLRIGDIDKTTTERLRYAVLSGINGGGTGLRALRTARHAAVARLIERHPHEPGAKTLPRKFLRSIWRVGI